MKKIVLGILMTAMLSGCFISRIFHKKEKYGCPTDGRNVGAEKIASGDEKAIRASNKAKYKGGRKSY
ncbi:MAG TPA: membrane lipoprotein lipid attachment site-containing protein [Ferruginibacter sp.]|nr:membrane lipoprotein lipid attachment site-containing protein [Ferruginibacter sp.]